MLNSKQFRWWAILGVAGLFALMIWGDWRSHPTKTSPDTETQPLYDEYAGNDRCLECHSDIGARYLQTGHAETFAHTSRSDWARQLDGLIFEDEERDLKYHYRFDERTGLSVSLPEQFGDKQLPLNFAIGSNQHALTFLQLWPDPTGETVGVEHRVSIFGPEGRLGLTPGHAGETAGNVLQMFGTVNPQKTVEACVGCHTTHFELKEHQLVNLIENVGCESCHGPGAQHVFNMSAGLEESAIDALRGDSQASVLHQIESCGACHRNVKDLKPSDIAPGNASLARFQPVGMLQSACFKQSAGKLSCTTCHNPHDRPSGQRAAILQSCLECHRPDHAGSTACRISTREGCIECHMPPVEVHPGIFFHDHWIRVHPETASFGR